jgi:elongation factor G
MTSGQGRYTISLSHYDPVPPNVQQLLVSQHEVKEDD